MIICKFWWVLAGVCTFIPAVGLLLNMAVRIIFLGWNYAEIYDTVEGGNNRVIGYISGWLQIIAVVKFFGYKV